MPKFNVFVTFEAPFSKVVQRDYHIVGGDLAGYLAENLKQRGFVVKSAQNIEYAFEIKCLSGQIEYGMTIGLDTVYNKRWEVAVQPRYNFLDKLFGKNEDKELSDLLNTVDAILHSDQAISDIKWYKSYNDPDSLKHKPYFEGPVVKLDRKY